VLEVTEVNNVEVETVDVEEVAQEPRAQRRKVAGAQGCTLDEDGKTVEAP
jgi:hypothetical protein